MPFRGPGFGFSAPVPGNKWGAQNAFKSFCEKLGPSVEPKFAVFQASVTIKANCPYVYDRVFEYSGVPYEKLYGNKGVSAVRTVWGQLLPIVEYVPQILCACAVKIRKFRYEAGLIETTPKHMNSFQWFGLCVPKENNPSAKYTMRVSGILPDYKHTLRGRPVMILGGRGN